MQDLRTAAMRQALNAIERALSDNEPYISHCKAAADALRAALAAEPEPVAWLHESGHLAMARKDFDFDTMLHRQWSPLYTHPAPAAQPLTDEQIVGIAHQCESEACDGSQTTAFARAIEHKHGIGDKT